jgi:ectoine hydroxylase-related dioxygenase (phytanoyl-CoA dioxygenase family)
MSQLEMVDVLQETWDELERVGYAIVPEVLTADEIAAVRSALEPHLREGPRGRSDFEGVATQRVYGLVAKSRAFDRLVLDPTALGIAEREYGPSTLLTAALAINLVPGQPAQALHFDDAFYPLPRPRRPVSISTLWAIDEFTAANGATIMCPGTHTWGEVDIGRAEFDRLATFEAAEAPPGSLLIYHGTIVHGGGANTTDHERLAVSIQYAAPWARQQENFMMELGLDGAREAPERVQELIGYNIHSLFMGMVDGRHPKKLLTR